MRMPQRPGVPSGLDRARPQGFAQILAPFRPDRYTRSFSELAGYPQSRAISAISVCGRTEPPMSASSTAPVRSVDIRSSIVTAFRRDLVDPGPQDLDLANERLDVSPSRWYLAGFLAPADDPLTQDGSGDR